MNFSFLMRYRIPSLFTPATTGTTLLPGLWSGNQSLGMRQKVPREEHSDFLVIKSGITPQRSIHGKGVKLVMDHYKLTKLSSTSSVENFRNKEMKGALLIPHICMFIIDVLLEMLALVSAMEPWNGIKWQRLKPVWNKRTNLVHFGWFTLLAVDLPKNILDLSALFCSFQ